jgi:hypothetical protein
MKSKPVITLRPVSPMIENSPVDLLIEPKIPISEAYNCPVKGSAARAFDDPKEKCPIVVGDAVVGSIDRSVRVV